jgi:hypothetical protein
MKIYSITEFWFANVLGVAAAAQCFHLVWVGRQAFPLHGHEALYEIFAFMLFVLFFFITFSCCCWEWLLLRMRLHLPEMSLTTSTVVFCSGVTSALFCISWWVTLYN